MRRENKNNLMEKNNDDDGYKNCEVENEVRVKRKNK